MRVNWIVRIKNPMFIAQIVLAIFTPILAYAGISIQEVVTWGDLLNLILMAVTNPYVCMLVIVSVFNAVTDPTTKGINDSCRAMGYTKPKEDMQ